jgi:low-affinity ferrous iron transport protein
MGNMIMGWLQSPGARTELRFAAKIPVADHGGVKALTLPDKEGPLVGQTDVSFSPVVKTKRIDRWLDRVVELSGSESVYVAFLVGLLVWAFLGIPYGSTSPYKIIISDVQAIVNLVFDAFLMRQQFNQHDNLLMVAGTLRSRMQSRKRMIAQLMSEGRLVLTDATRFSALVRGLDAYQLPKESRLTRVSSAASWFLGHIGTAFGFCCCIVVWLAFGPYCGWSSTWQLYINSATSALMILLLAFLANVRERHSRHTAERLGVIWEADVALEIRLRVLTGDHMPNPTVIIPERQRSSVQRAIDYYADLVGTLTGIAILIVVIVAWIACGPALGFKANWWLLIGTYAGLVGLNDGYVLRNICQVLGDHEDEQFAKVTDEDLDTLAMIGVEACNEDGQSGYSFSYRMSVRVGYFCSHQWTVVAGLVFIVALIAGASVMRWNETGQLLCNIPPSIVESFLTLILITGHNVSEEKRRKDTSDIYLRRVQLLAHIR